MRVYTAEWSARTERYRIRRRDVPMRDGDPLFGVATVLRPRWLRTMRETLAFVNERQAALTGGGTAG